jgi:hypothetical protein
MATPYHLSEGMELATSLMRNGDVMTRSLEEKNYSYLQTHKKSLRIQLHPASALTAAIKKVTRTRQAQTGKTSQKYRQHKQELYSNTCSPVGTRMPARNPVPLDFTNIPRRARYMKKSPLHSRMLSSRKAPATKGARPTLPGLTASSPSACRSFLAGWPKRP